MSEAIVRELWTYPVKGCRGIPVDEIEVTRMGVTGDRCFVLWADGKLVDQIETPQLAALSAGTDAEGRVLRFEHPEKGSFEHSIAETGETREAQWVLDHFETVDQGDEAADWLSAALGKAVRLVSPGPQWKVNFPIPQMARVHEQPKQRFYSASPVSLANQASLDDLNGRLESPVPMDRFRMNVIVDGLDAYEEDRIDSFTCLLYTSPSPRDA